MANIVDEISVRHVSDTGKKTPKRELYRMYYYDCPPYEGQQRLPIPPEGNRTGKTINFKRHPPYVLRSNFQEILKSKRKVALRMGVLGGDASWVLHPAKVKELIKGSCQWSDLTNDDFFLDIKQKAVDLKLGMDITTMTLNKHVEVIVLVAGDADFVPAAKLARTHGVDFVLDPLWDNHSKNLSEHVDGIKSFDLVSMIQRICRVEPIKRPDWWNAN